MSRLVISYRREDSAAYAGRLYDRLVSTLGKDRVFMDIDAIPPGEDFVDVIEKALSKADVVLVLIGPRWASAQDAQGKRLHNPLDFVRLEVGTALKRGIRVVPILVGGSTMPNLDELPEDLTPLARRNAFEISDTRFHLDVDRLVGSLHELAPDPHEPVATPGSSSAALGQDEDGALTQGGDSEPEVQGLERRLEEIRVSPWIEKNILWSLGFLSLGLYYYYAANLVVTRMRESFDPSRSHAGFARSLLPGLLAHCTGWILTVPYLYMILVKPSTYVQFVDLVLAGLCIAFWIGSAWLLFWFWRHSRALASQIPRPAGEEPKTDKSHTRNFERIFSFLVIFGLDIFVLVKLQRLLVEGVTSVGISGKEIFTILVLILVIPFLVIMAAYSSFKGILDFALTGTYRAPGKLQLMRLHSFWFWMFLHVFALVGAYYVLYRDFIQFGLSAW